MTINAQTRLIPEEDQKALPVDVPIGIDLEEVSVIHPDPDGGTALFVRGEGWHWIDLSYEEVYPLWEQSKRDRAARQLMIPIGLGTS